MKTFKKSIKNLITRLLLDSMYEILEEKITEKLEHCIIIIVNDEIIETRGMIVVPNIGEKLTLIKHQKVIVKDKLINSTLGHEVRLFCEYV